MILWIAGFIVVLLSITIGFVLGASMAHEKGYDEGRRHEYERLKEYVD